MLKSKGDDGDISMPYLRAAHVQPGGLHLHDVKEMWFSPDEAAQLSLLSGDVVVVEGGAGYGRSAYIPSTLDGWGFQNSINRVRPRAGFIGRFLDFAIKSAMSSGQLDNLVNQATIPHLTAEKLAVVPVPHASLTEQQSITDYLDHETAAIDALISDQQEALELLSSRWKSELVNCVQTGVDKETHTTDDDTWPRAPQGWRQTRLKVTTTSVRNGAWGAEPEADETTVRCIRVADFDKIHGSVHDQNITTRSYPATVMAESALHPGDLIIEKSGGGPTTPVGNVVRYDGAGGEMYSNFVARIEIASGVDSSYALRLHQALYTSGVTTRSIKQTTGIQNLDATSYFAEPIFLPPLAEQQRIAEHLAARRNDIDELSADLTRAIALAKERRSALITAAVTGQIDVTAKHRPAAEQLEDDIKELT
ncbi:hypothetical protein M3F63_05355 [Brachybacterium muris]|uniref:hypothetical protein n=1 Tax=Brachybacterium muris TaxID=219301 RepID=UPI00223A6BC4|nr:hypothetical protein [Brachybacterium muris]MCT2177096.1 hypothetical protein [Brachybacterium muris]